MAIKKFFQNFGRKKENEPPDFENMQLLYGPPPGRSESKKKGIFQIFKKRAAGEDPADNLMQTVYGPPSLFASSKEPFTPENNIEQDMYGPLFPPLELMCENCGHQLVGTVIKLNQASICPNCGLVQRRRK